MSRPLGKKYVNAAVSIEKEIMDKIVDEATRRKTSLSAVTREALRSVYERRSEQENQNKSV
jgi:hypothetical protein